MTDASNFPFTLRHRDLKTSEPDNAALTPTSIPPKKRGDYFLTVNRSALFFKEQSVESGKKLNDAALLALQEHFVPYTGGHVNLIYSMEKGKSRRYFSWIGPETETLEGFYYDEVPESLLFNCSPAALKSHEIFIFRRTRGFEAIYLKGIDFCSIYAAEESMCGEAAVMLARKYSLHGIVRVFSEAELDFREWTPTPEAETEEDFSGAFSFRVTRSDGSAKRSLFLPDMLPLKKRYSNIAGGRRTQGTPELARRWERLADWFLLLLLIAGLAVAAGYFFLLRDAREFSDSYQVTRKMADRCNAMEFSMEKVRRLASTYPDHMRQLKAVTEAADLDTTLIRLSLGEETMTLEGYAVNSLLLLEQLGKSGAFKEVKFKSTVIKNESSNREKFEIEMTLPKNGENASGMTQKEEPQKDESPTGGAQ